MTKKVRSEDDFVLVGNTSKKRPIHVQSLGGHKFALCGRVIYPNWNKTDIPGTNFCSSCEKALNKMGYRVEIYEIVKND